MSTFTSKAPNRLVSDLVLDLFNKADLHSSRDRFGRVRYLLAELPADEFYALYQPSVQAVVYNRGLWLTLNAMAGRMWVTGKLCKTQLDIAVCIDAKGQNVLVIQYKERVIKRVRLSRYTVDTLMTTPAGVQLLSNIAKSCLNALGENARAVLSASLEPVIHVFPKIPEPVSDVTFSKDLVSFH